MRPPAGRRVLAVRGELAADPLRRWLRAHALPGAERHLDGVHERVVPTGAGPVEVSVDLGTSPGCEQVVLHAPAAALDEVEGTVRRWLGLDADPAEAEAWLARDPLLAPLVAARPGLRVPRAVAGVETAVLTVLGQQVSLAAARTFGGRLVAAFGTPVSSAPSSLTAFPAAAVLADAGAEAIRAATGVTGARARTVHALAAALAGGLDLDAAAGDPERAGAARARLLALPGIGPWTADYVALRVLGDRDAFLPGDLVLRRALGGLSPKEAAARAEPWRPWRGHALLHLWTAAVFVP
ncbi:AlkA N-terminal domain-containing protein [Kineococcus radiotolerans]|uniref:DNA-3-methyladenine glycosylase II n=1 Tax=Kineococcus radiotolerans (strain ATCC BAA-149 / DSM 14245 / SRS30216) TaxID=266940 RepID=A6WG49_KINRD|nr:AlkA N-terminal domain-containing protein [Kineococcus radiotolerans]ABS05788.1 HhH-GPD family protein [Kineococcus radiotolerans SRS30216 = ATCC BAA-149]